MSWHNEYRKVLTENQALENGQLIANFLIKKGWSKNAISALIGNMWVESYVNPNMYELGFDWSQDMGFGLVQWTPRSKYWNWALNNGYSENEIRNGKAQLERLIFEMNVGGQYYPTNNYPETFKEFSKSTKNLEYLTNAFTWNYERPNYDDGVASLPERIRFANKAFNTLDFSGNNEEPPKQDKPQRPNTQKPKEELENWVQDQLEDLQQWKDNLLEQIQDKIKDMTTAHTHSISHDRLFKNKYIKVEKTYNNTYKVSMNDDFFEQLAKDIKLPEIELPEIKDPETPTEPPTEPKPDTEVNTCYLKPFRRLQQPYGNYFDNYGNRAGARHNGVDTRMNMETLKSPVKMKITHVAYDQYGYGNYIKGTITSDIKEKGLTLILAHLSKVNVSVGQNVSVGDTLGVTGNTGYWFDTTVYNGVYGKGEHLHVELQDSKYNSVDPTNFIWNNCSKTKGKPIEYNIMTYLPSVMGAYDDWKENDPTAWAIFT